MGHSRAGPLHLPHARQRARFISVWWALETAPLKEKLGVALEIDSMGRPTSNDSSPKSLGESWGRGHSRGREVR